MTQLPAEDAIAAEGTDTVHAPRPLPLARLFARRTPRRPRGLLGWAWWAFTHHLGFLLNTALIAGVVLLIVLLGRWQAPDWVEARASAAITEMLPGISAELGSAELEWSEGQPVLRLRDSVLLSESDTRLAIADLRLRLSRAALLSRTLRPESLEITALELDLTRDAEGRFNLALGREAPDGQGATLGAMIDAIEHQFQRDMAERLELVEIGSVALHYRDERAGRSWRSEAGNLRLERAGDRIRMSLFLPLASGEASQNVAFSVETEIGGASALFAARFNDLPARDLAAQSPALAWLAALDAPISGALRAEMGADNSLGPLSATLSIGAGALQPTEASRPLEFERASTYFTYTPDSRTLSFDQIELQGGWGRAVARGQAFLEGPALPSAISAQLRVDATTVALPDVFDAPLALSQAGLEFRVGLAPFVVDIAAAHAEVDGAPLYVSGEASATRDGWHLALDGEAGPVGVATALRLWPKPLGPKARLWVEENLRAGQLDALQLALRLRPGEALERYVAFRFTDAELKPLRSFPDVTGADGRATLIGDLFAVEAEAGQITAPDGGVVSVAGTRMEISRIGTKPTRADLALQAEGDLPDLLRLLDLEPFRVLQRIKRGPDLAEGRAQVQVAAEWDMRRPLPPGAVSWQAEGLLSDVTSGGLVPGRRLSAERLRLQADNNVIRIGGAGQLDGVAFNADWEQGLGERRAEGGRVEGTVRLDADAARAFGLVLPEGTIGAGVTEAALDLRLPLGGAPRLSLDSDLRGLALAFAPLGAVKPRGEAGRLEVVVQLGPRPVVDRLRLDAGGLRAEGALRLGPNGLESASFASLQAGDWLAGAVELTGRGRGVPPAITLRGADINWARRPRTSSGGASQAVTPLRLVGARLALTERILLTNLHADLSLGSGVTGPFQAELGAARIEGRARGQGSGTAWDIRTDQAGEALMGIGLLTSAEGGRLRAVLTPGTNGIYDGQAEVSALRVRQWPLLGAALNAVSLVGLVDQLSGNGIQFTDGRAAFRLGEGGFWLDSLALVGPAVGVSASGAVNFQNRRMQIEGVMSPAYVLNALGRVISSRDGEGAFGFQFQVLGSTDSPQLQVNPVSILLPGALRDLFRGG